MTVWVKTGLSAEGVSSNYCLTITNIPDSSRQASLYLDKIII